MPRLPSSLEQIEAAIATCPTVDVVPWRHVSHLAPDLGPDWRSRIPAHVLIEALIAHAEERRTLINRLHDELREARAESLKLRDAARTLVAAVDIERLFEVTL
jgi:hypothetical protein